MASGTMMETTSMMDTHSFMKFNLLDSVCEQFDVDLDTLYAQVAKHHTEANKEKHNHWRPPKASSLPGGDV